MSEQDIFIEAIELDNPEERSSFLDQACGDDAELRKRVEYLIQHSEEIGSFLEHPVLEATNTPTPEPTEIGDGPRVSRGEQETVASETMLEETVDYEDEIPLDFLSSSDREDSLGRLKHYEILEVIGRGAFGIVLKAFDESLQRVVAIKILSPEMAVTSPARKRFRREAESSAKVRHENVVAIHAVEDDPTPFLVMEYIPGETLQQRLNRTGPLESLETLRLGKQMADGLAAAHAKGLIHRDIKPGNILLESDVTARVKITDFGLARAADDASITRSGVIAGTPMYMAPEQALGHQLDQRADLFSLGSVLYQMVSGRPPFRAPSTVAVLKRVAEDNPRPIREIIPETPDWMCLLIDHLHAKEPEQRYGSAQEVVSVLEKCIAAVEAGNIPESVRPAHLPPVERPQVNAKAPSWGKNLSRGIVALVALLILFCVSEMAGVTSLTGLADHQDAKLPKPESIAEASESNQPESVNRKPQVPPSKVGGYTALEFDGETYVETDVRLVMDQPFTLEAWVTPRNLDSTVLNTVISNAQGAGYSLELSAIEELAWQFSVHDQEGYRFARTKQFPVNDRRVHLAGVFDGKQCLLYVNGQVVAGQIGQVITTEEALLLPIRASDLPLMIGANPQGEAQPVFYFVGKIDEIRISQSARYSKEFTPDDQFKPDKSTVALYHFDEGQGEVLKDASGNGHHGKIVGGKWVQSE